MMNFQEWWKEPLEEAYGLIHLENGWEWRLSYHPEGNDFFTHGQKIVSSEEYWLSTGAKLISD